MTVVLDQIEKEPVVLLPLGRTLADDGILVALGQGAGLVDDGVVVALVLGGAFLDGCLSNCPVPVRLSRVYFSAPDVSSSLSLPKALVGSRKKPDFLTNTVCKLGRATFDGFAFFFCEICFSEIS